MSKRGIGTIGMIGAAGSLALVAIAELAGRLHERIGMRSTVYSAFAAALLIAVLVDAALHHLTHEQDIESSVIALPAWLQDDRALDGDPVDPTSGADPLLPELQLAARLGAELMGERPASRTPRDLATGAGRSTAGSLR